MDDSKSYKLIFKATFLFGSVQVFTIIINVIKNKVIAFLLGTSGIGIIGLFTSSYSMIQSAAGLGINQSAVRNLSEVKNENNENKTSKIVTVVSRLLWFTSILGAVITILLSKRLSIWTFGNEVHSFEYMLLSIVVFLNIFNLGQHAILQGMRMLKPLASASILGASVGLVLSIPLYYFLGEDGIVLSLILTGLSAVLISRFYVNRIRIKKTYLSLKDTIANSKEMIKLGVSLMMMSFIVSGVGLILRAYISNYGNVDQVGVFQAGYTIIHSYFGMVFTAMSKDYFPRISAINKDNQKVRNATNQQAEIALLLIGPLIILLLFLSPLLIRILYTENFLEAVSFVNLAVFGIIFQAGSQTMGLILIAKNRGDLFVYTVLGFQTIFLLNNILLYRLFGIEGLGLSFAINMLIHLAGIQLILYKTYKITYSTSFYKILLITLIFSLFSYFTRNVEQEFIKYFIGFVILCLSASFSYSQLKKVMGIKSVGSLLKKKIQKR